MRYGARVDVKHREIRDGLRQCGVFVLDGARWGKGAPDLLCYTQWTGWVPLEVKTRRDDCKRTKAQPMTAQQVKLHQQAPIVIVETLEESLRIFGVKP